MRFSVLLVLSLALTAPAHAFTKEQESMIGHVALAMATEDRCPQYQMNTASMAIRFMTMGLKIDDALRDRLQIEFNDMKRTITPHKTEDVCKVGYALYGPGGAVAANILQMK
jgi:hypothetical protein